MRIFLDECVPQQIAKLLNDHECRTAKDCGWVGIQNGKLLTLAQTEFDCFLTSDQNIRYQQNLKEFDIAVLELSTNNLRRIERAITTIELAILNLQNGELRKLTIP